MISINRDNFENITPPDFILKKPSGDRLGVVPCITKSYDRKFNEPDEIQFTTPLFYNNEQNEFYEDIEVMKYIEVYGIGLFLITSVNESSEGTEHAAKEVTAKSCEVTLGQKYLNEFYINTGETGSIDDVQFYKISDHSHSLLHLAIKEKFPEWSIGHVDTLLTTMQRSFTVDSQDVYSFLMEDVATAFDCFFIFDSLNRIINVYQVDTYGTDTNISISYNNLLKDTELTCDVEDIKTAMTITGEDELTVREIAMGFETIYNLDYYNSLEFWSQGLYDAYNAWVTLYNSKVNDYTALLQQDEAYYDQIAEMESTRTPAVDDYLNWVNMTKAQATTDMKNNYSYNLLKEKQLAYEQKQAVYMKAGYGEYQAAADSNYKKYYLPVYNVLSWIAEVLTFKQNQINAVKTQQLAVQNQMRAIINLVSMTNNFTAAQLKELSLFIRETTLTSDNYVVTDTMTTTEKYSMLNDMLTYGRKELAKIAIPQLSFTASVLNLFTMPEFDNYSGDFDIGNYIWVTLRDDFHIKAKLLSIHFDYYDKNNFTVTFGNIARKANNIYTDITEAINTATSVATSVSFNSSYWSESSQEANYITEMIDQGLLAAGAVLTDGTSSEIIMDKRGLFINTNDYLDDGVTPNPYAGDSIFLGGGRILFTDNDWLTVSEAVGRIQVNSNSVFGVIAKAVIAGYIWGGEIRGTKIYVGGGGGTSQGTAGQILIYDANGAEIGHWTSSGIQIKDGTIQSADFTNGTAPYASSGIQINLSSTPHIKTKNFAIKANGDAYFRGDVVANGATIGGSNGWEVKAGYIHNVDGPISSAVTNLVAGTYIGAGTNGILNTTGGETTADCKYVQIKSGTLTANNVEIKGGHLKVGSNFEVASGTGKLTASGADITGVLNADTGTIGGSSGWEIVTGYIHNVDGPTSSAVNNTKAGTYIGAGTSGILNTTGGATAASRKYVQILNGKITANNVDIDGGSIDISGSNNTSFSASSTGISVTGEIKATSGKIGTNAINQITIGNNATHASIYSGNKSSRDDANDGFYLGTNGFSLGNKVFVVTNDGKVTIKNGSIQSSSFSDNTSSHYSNSGIKIDLDSNGSIKAKNFAIDSSGNAYFQGQLSATSGSIAGWYINTAGGLTDSLTDPQAWVRTNLIACGAHGSCLISMHPTSDDPNDVRKGYLTVEVNVNEYVHVYYDHIERSSGPDYYVKWWDGSDERLKKDIKPLTLEEAKSIILNVEPLTFKYKSNENGKNRDTRYYGVTAQRMNKLCEELGLENPYVRYGNLSDDLMDVAYEQFIAPLMKVVQSQQEEITTLKSEVDTLKAELDEIKKMLRKEAGTD